MPLYAFRCLACQREFDRLLSLREDPGEVRCPECDSPVRRLVTTFSTVGACGTSGPGPPEGG
jgi:putative FmdB family regulatory protein